MNQTWACTHQIGNSVPVGMAHQARKERVRYFNQSKIPQEAV